MALLGSRQCSFVHQGIFRAWSLVVFVSLHQRTGNQHTYKVIAYGTTITAFCQHACCIVNYYYICQQDFRVNCQHACNVVKDHYFVNCQHACSMVKYYFCQQDFKVNCQHACNMVHYCYICQQDFRINSQHASMVKYFCFCQLDLRVNCQHACIMMKHYRRLSREITKVKNKFQNPLLTRSVSTRLQHDKVLLSFVKENIYI